MVMSWVFTAMIALSLAFGLLRGTLPLLTAALFRGAASAVTLTLSLCGTLCLWSGVLHVMEAVGLSGRLAAALRPLLRRLFPAACRDPEAAQAISGNFTANLLGLGNAATPPGLQAVQRMKRLSGSDRATDEMCRLIVMNTASIQLLPTTVAAVRASLGAAAPFDILPAVWITSAVSVAAGLLSAQLFRRFSHA